MTICFCHFAIYLFIFYFFLSPISSSWSPFNLCLPECFTYCCCISAASGSIFKIMFHIFYSVSQCIQLVPILGAGFRALATQPHTSLYSEGATLPPQTVIQRILKTYPVMATQSGLPKEKSNCHHLMKKTALPYRCSYAEMPRSTEQLALEYNNGWMLLFCTPGKKVHVPIEALIKSSLIICISCWREGHTNSPPGLITRD